MYNGCILASDPVARLQLLEYLYSDRPDLFRDNIIDNQLFSAGFYLSLNLNRPILVTFQDLALLQLLKPLALRRIPISTAHRRLMRLAVGIRAGSAASLGCIATSQIELRRLDVEGVVDVVGLEGA